MNSCVVNICIFLFLTVQGTLGSELTIKVWKNASVTLECYSSEKLVKCCPSTPQNCPKCTDTAPLNHPSVTYSRYKYNMLSGLKPSDSGLYVCLGSHRNLGKKYRLNVIEDKNPTVVIGTVGQPIILSCCPELDNMTSLGNHWCRLANASACHGSFSLEKRNLTHNDTGSYRITQTFQNQTKVHVVELQVKDKPDFLQVSPVLIKHAQLQIQCQYSQELQDYQKSWLCNSAACPETVRSVDDRFQSALILTIDHAACSSITSFECVAENKGRYIKSNVYSRALPRNPVLDVEVPSYVRFDSKKVKVNIYTQLTLICYKRDRYYDYYDRFGPKYEHIFRPPITWCRLSGISYCPKVTENVVETRFSLNLQICVTPNDDGARYRCSGNTEIQIVVNVPPPPAPPPRPRPPPPPPPTHNPNIINSTSASIIIVVVTVILLIIILLVAVSKFQGKNIRERLFARRTELTAVDAHANMYANLVANYYSNNRRIAPLPDKQEEGDDKEASSSSDDEFEELPVRPQTSSSVIQEETDYVRVKPGRAARAQSKTNKAKKQFQGSAQSSSGYSEDKEDDDEDEVTYTHVIIKPKQQPK
ncbi:uncharacterized protein LOC131968808 [Centropristis striata]|uniref:uncharacterized protein LOC131968808 n=1 Tax=Centropristis striata TaxID=184440 RepID=UPI0027E0E005|nr:uncharacterized protein LOC131968808 [Centropristis striata]